MLNERFEQSQTRGLSNQHVWAALETSTKKNYSNDADIDADKSRYKNANPNTSFQGSNNSVSFH